MSLHEELGDLNAAAQALADSIGIGPEAVDPTGWTLLHHAAAESQHGRGMFEVVRGLLEVMPVEVVDQRTGGGKSTGWSALSFVSNARDATTERADIAQL